MFDIQVSKDDLSAALAAIDSTVGDNSQNMGDDCISITDLGNNKIELYTTNSIEFSKVSIIITKGSNGTQELMPYVNFKRFKKMIDSIPSGEFIFIKALVNDIEINYGRRKKPLKLTGSTNGMINLPSVTGTNSISIDSSVLHNCINKVSAIIKDDKTISINNCMRISADNFNVEISAIDSRYSRMFYSKFTNTIMNQGDIFVEVNKFKNAFKLFANMDTIVFEDNQNLIKIHGEDPDNQINPLLEAEYYLRKLTGVFPAGIDKIFNGVKEYATINKDELKASLARIDAIDDVSAGGDMDITIDKDFVNIVKTSQYGIVEDSFGLENKISTPIKETFKTKAIGDILKCFADNSTYNTPNTFEIGLNTNGTNKYYILREVGSSTNMFLVTGSATSTTP